MVHGFDFTRMLRRYRMAASGGDEETMSRVTKWIRGEYRTKSEARAELGSSTIISDAVRSTLSCVLKMASAAATWIERRLSQSWE